MRRAARTSVVAGLAALVVAGCSDGGDGGGGRPESPAAPPTSQGVQVPPVTTPVDPAPFLGEPCQLIGRDLLSDVGDFEPGEPDVDSDAARNLLGPGCGWRSKDLTQDVSLRIGTVRREKAAEGLKGMAAVYDSKQSGGIDELQPLALEGHPGNPAAVAGKAEDIRRGDCPIEVGIADDLTYIVRFSDMDNPEGACVVAQRLATAVLDTMAKGS